MPSGGIKKQSHEMINTAHMIWVKILKNEPSKWYGLPKQAISI